MARIGTAFIQIDGDFGPLRRQLKEFQASQQGGITLKVSADIDQSSFANAKRKAGTLGGREEVKLSADVNMSSFARAKGAVAILTKESNKLGDVFSRSNLSIGQWTGILASALPVIVDVTGALGALTASLGAAAAGLGALAIGGVGAAGVGFGGIAGIAVPAIKGLKDLMTAQQAADKSRATGAQSAGRAQAAAAQQIKSAQEAVATANRGVSDSERQLADAQRSEKTAQDALTLARKDATRQLQDMKRAAIEGATSEKRAQLSLEEAQQNLQQVRASGTADTLQIRDAELSVVEARQNLRDVTIQSKRDQQDYNKAQKQGISGMPQVVSAQQQLAQAQRGVQDAQRGVAQAHRDVAKALDNLAFQQKQANTATQAGGTAMAALALAQKKAGPEAVKFAASLKHLTTRWKELTAAGRSDFFGLLNDGMKRLEGRLPLFAKSANESMKALRVGVDQFLKRAVDGSEFTKFINVMTRTFANSMKPLGDALGNVAKVFERIAVAVAPDIVRMAKGVDDITKGWVRSTRNAGDLRDTIHSMVNQAHTWEQLIKEAGRLLIAVLAPGAQQGKQAVQGITDQLKEWTRWVNAHPKEMRDFFKEGLKTTKELVQVLIGFIPQLFQISVAMRPIARLFLSITKALNTLKIGNVSAFTVLLGALVGAKIVSGAAGIVTAINRIKAAFIALRTAAAGAAAAETAATVAGTGAGAGGMITTAASTRVLGGAAVEEAGATAGAGFLAGFGGAFLAGGGLGAIIGAGLVTKGGVLDDIKGKGVTLGSALGDALTTSFGKAVEQGIIPALKSASGPQLQAALKDTGITLSGLLPADAASRLREFAQNAQRAAAAARAVGDTDAAAKLQAIADKASKAADNVDNIPKAFQNVGKVLKDKSTLSSKPLTDAVIKPLEQMSPAARHSTIEMLREQAKTLREKGEITKSEYRRFMAALQIATGRAGGIINRRWQTAFQALADRTATGAKKVRDAFGTSEWTHFLGQKPWQGVAANWRQEFRHLADVTATGAQKVRDAFGPGSPWDKFLKGFDRFKKDSGSLKGFKPPPGFRPRKDGGPFGGQYGGLVTAGGIVPMGFQHGGIVGTTGLKPGPRDTIHALLEVGELVIPKELVDKTRSKAKATALVLSGEIGKGYKKVLDETKDFVKGHGKDFDGLSKTYKLVGDNAKGFVDRHGSLFQRLRTDSDKETTRFKKRTTDDFAAASQQSSDQVKRMKSDVSDNFQRMNANAQQQATAMKKGVVGDFDNMNTGVHSGIQRLAQMTNAALKALGVKKIDFTASSGGGKKGAGKQLGGMVVPGQGSGDKVPLHAMVEPGEKVFVLNRTASKVLDWLQGFNSEHPRFQRGGTIGLQGGGFAGMHPAIVALAKSFLSKFGGTMSSGLRPGDPGFHGRGLAADIVPAKWGPATRYANQIGPQLLEGIHRSPPGTDVSWDTGKQVPSSFWGASTWAAHNTHIHLAVSQMVKGVAGAVAKKIAEVTLKGPKGPLRDMGNAVLKRVHDAANKLIAKKTPASVGTEILSGIQGSIPKVFAAVARKLNAGPVPTLALFEAGLAESGMRDLPGGDASSQGVLQLLASTAANLGVSPHDVSGVASLFLTHGFWRFPGAIQQHKAAPGKPAYQIAQDVQGSGAGLASHGASNYGPQKGAALALMRQQGLSTKNLKGYLMGGLVGPFVGSFRQGGPVKRDGLGLLHKGEHVVPKLAGGGTVDSHSGGWLRTLDKLRKLIARQTKAIAVIDERVDISQRLAELQSSPSGSELSKGEMASQLALQRKLLAALQKTLRISHEGIQITRKAVQSLKEHVQDIRHKINRERRQRKPDKSQITKWHAEITRAASQRQAFINARAPFTEQIVELAGLTGHGGRIFDTQLAIKELKSSAATSQPLHLDELLAFAEALKFGAFRSQGLPGFAGGGVVPGPIGMPQTVIAHGGETITPPGREPVVEVNFSGNAAWLRQFVDVQINHRDARETARYRRGPVRS